MSRLVAFMLAPTLLSAIAASARAAEPDVRAKTDKVSILFSESFEDANLAERGWYDGTTFRITGDAMAGKGCIEYEWPDRQSGVKGSSPVRRLFDPTDEVSIRFYLRLSKGWGWSGRNYHPHLTHFLTTENSKWHGPAASHLTLYIEPVYSDNYLFSRTTTTCFIWLAEMASFLVWHEPGRQGCRGRNRTRMFVVCGTRWAGE